MQPSYFLSEDIDYYQSNQNHDCLTVLQKIAQGDKSAVKECLELYESAIWRFSRRFINNSEDAEDLMQDIFIDIWKSAAHFDPSRSPEWAFVKLIAKRRLIDRLRKQYHCLSTISLEGWNEQPRNNVHNDLQINIELLSVLAALNELSSMDNKIIRMSFYEGMSHKEIAECINLPLGTVKTRILRSIKKLRSSLHFSKNRQVAVEY